MNKRLSILCLLAVVLMSGCQGTISGRDTVEPVAGYVQGGDIAITPVMGNNTQIKNGVAQFLEYSFAGNYGQAFDMLVFEDSTFVTEAGFASWFTGLNLDPESYTLTETTVDKQRCVSLTSSGETLTFIPVQEEGSSSWKYRLDAFVARDFTIYVPSGIPLTLDGVDLEPYKATQDSSDVYTIPQIINTEHEIAFSTVFNKEPSTLTISNCNESINIEPYLSVTGNTRSQLIKTASSTLVTLNPILVAQDWDKFCKLFDSTVDTSAYSAAFYKARVKGNVYELSLLETRDLEQSDMDIRYTGYNTVMVVFGAKWQWADSDNVRIDSEGNVTVRKYQSMRSIHSVELSYNEDTKKWMLHYVDDESLVRLTDGLEQWR